MTKLIELELWLEFTNFCYLKSFLIINDVLTQHLEEKKVITYSILCISLNRTFLSETGDYAKLKDNQLMSKTAKGINNASSIRISLNRYLGS